MTETARGNKPGDPTPTPPHRLEGSLGVRDLVFTVLAYNAPLAVMAGFVPLVVGYGNGVGAPATFIVIGVLLVIFSVGLTTMSTFMKSPGAFYSYITAGLGRVPGLGGAMTAFTGYTAIAAASCAYAGILANDLVHGLLSGPDIPWWACALAIWAIASALSLLHIDLSAKVLGIAMVCEMLLVLIWDVRVFADGGASGVSFASFTPAAFGSGSLSFALLFGILCVTGFEAVAVFREETRDPVRTVPRATYLAVGILAGMYAVGAWAYLTAFGPKDALAKGSTDPSGSFVASVGTYAGTVAADLVTILLVTSAFAAILATQNISARYLYTLGRDGVLPRQLGAVHRRHRSPFIAAATTAAIVLAGFAIPAAAGVDPLVIYASTAGFGGFCLLLLMTATSAAVIAFFHTAGHTANPFQATIAPLLSFGGLVTILYLAARNMGAVIGGSETAGNVALAIAAGIILSGAALALYYRSARPEIYSRIGSQDV